MNKQSMCLAACLALIGVADLARADAVLGVLAPTTEAHVEDDEIAAVEALVQQREAARQSQDYATADQLRQAIEQRGIVLEDTAQGPRWRRRT